MDNAQKAIMIGVGLFITIIIISAVLLIVNLGTGLMGDATSQLGTISGSLRGEVLNNWDGKVKSGSEVLAFIRQYANSDAISIYINSNPVVYVGAGQLSGNNIADSAKYGPGGITDCSVNLDGATSSYSEVVSKKAISTSSYYKTAVVYDTNSNVIGVAITKSN